MNWLTDAINGLRNALSTQAELHQRVDLAARPWTQDQLHWAIDADGRPVLHGRYLPTTPRRVTTAAGWCGCRARRTSGAPDAAGPAVSR